jgi:hypothetical protein
MEQNTVGSEYRIWPAGIGHNISRSDNVAMGNRSMLNNYNGNRNIAIDFAALKIMLMISSRSDIAHCITAVPASIAIGRSAGSQCVGL